MEVSFQWIQARNISGSDINDKSHILRGILISWKLLKIDISSSNVLRNSINIPYSIQWPSSPLRMSSVTLGNRSLVTSDHNKYIRKCDQKYLQISPTSISFKKNVAMRTFSWGGRGKALVIVRHSPRVSASGDRPLTRAMWTPSMYNQSTITFKLLHTTSVHLEVRLDEWPFTND